MPELRHDPLTGSWVVITPERGRRPQQFVAAPTPPTGPSALTRLVHEDDGHERLLQVPGPDGPITVVVNLFPALEALPGGVERAAHGPFDSVAAVGAHEVVIETGDPDVDLRDMSAAQIAEVLVVWRDRVRDLHRDRRLRYVACFRNRGRTAGASQSHAHSQIAATPILPPRIAGELARTRDHWERTERCLTCDVLAWEQQARERLVRVDERFVSVCPFASVVPFQVVITPREHLHDFAASSREMLRACAEHLRDVLRRVSRSLDEPDYNLILVGTPNTMAFAERPDAVARLASHWHWRLELLPRMEAVAGFEWATDIHMNPTSPEACAEHLRRVDTT